jgi:hypothetical protein
MALAALAAGCAADGWRTAGRAFDPTVSGQPVDTGSGVLRAGFDADALAPAPPRAASYACPMHPEVRASEPSACPKCGMQLTPAAPALSAVPPASASPAGDRWGVAP